MPLYDYQDEQFGVVYKNVRQSINAEAFKWLDQVKGALDLTVTDRDQRIPVKRLLSASGGFMITGGGVANPGMKFHKEKE